MHNAPAVTYPVGRSSVQTWMNVLLLALSAAVGGLWFFLAERPDWRQALTGGAWLVCAALAWNSLRWPRLGILRWDGQTWHWESKGAVLAGSAVPRLDWQAGVLLEFRSSSNSAFWLWPERDQQAVDWEALRRALWAPGTAGSPPPLVVEQAR